MARPAARRKISAMTLAELKAEHAACLACACRGCAIRSKDVAEAIALREAEAAAVVSEEDTSQWDPVLLAVGIRMPKAKQKRVLEPVARRELAARFSKMLSRQNSIRSITARQERFDRLHGLRGVVVRG